MKHKAMHDAHGTNIIKVPKRLIWQIFENCHNFHYISVSAKEGTRQSQSRTCRNAPISTSANITTANSHNHCQQHYKYSKTTNSHAGYAADECQQRLQSDQPESHTKNKYDGKWPNCLHHPPNKLKPITFVCISPITNTFLHPN